jgi:hypothetical protein
VAYIGTQPVRGQYRKLSDISSGFNGSTTTFTTSVPPGTSNYYVTAGSASQLLVSLGGVIQQPDVDYTVNTYTITFTTAPAAGLSFFGVLMGDSLNSGSPADGSVTTSKLAGNLSVGLTGGSASTPSLYFTGDANTGIYSPGADTLAFVEGGVEAMRIDSSGRVGINIASPGALLDVSGSGNIARFGDGTNTFDVRFKGPNNWAVQLDTSADKFNIQRNSSPLVTVDSSGRVGIGTTSPSGQLSVTFNGNSVQGIVATDTGTAAAGNYYLLCGSSGGIQNVASNEIHHSAVSALAFRTGSGNGSERARIDSSGRLLVGTSTARGQLGITPGLQSEGTSFSQGTLALTVNSTSQYPLISLARSRGTTLGSNTIVADGDIVGKIFFTAADGNDMDSAVATIEAVIDGTPGSDDLPGRLVFSTTADGASSPTERMRISSGGAVGIGKTPDFNPATNGFEVDSGACIITRAGSAPLFINRNTDDGTLVSFRQAATEEGTISVSGTTVSYNGAHLSRWSQLPSGTERTEILRGTVLSNIDEMCAWGEEANEQLNRMKVSDVEGDPNVSGVFQAWDDDDDTYTDDFYCAMTGDFIIRIAEGIPVNRGQLLMSAGDGTAIPQDDDIVRSKTIAKVTSHHVTCTYDDGSYCVPCVLMAC